MRPLGLAMSLKVSALSSLDVFLVMLKGVPKNEAHNGYGVEEMVGNESNLAAGRPRRRSSSTCERKVKRWNGVE